MNPTISNSDTPYGDRIHISYVPGGFLKQNVDLNLEYDVFDRPLKNYISLSKSPVSAPELGFNVNFETAKFLASKLEPYRINPSSLRLQNNRLMVHVYSLAENSSDQYLFVNRIVTKLSTMSREEWMTSYGKEEYDCCFDNYCRNLNLDPKDKLPAEKEVTLEHLDGLCCLKPVNVEVRPLIWCYQLGSCFKEQEEEMLILGLRVNRSGIIKGMPLICQFPYGSMFKKDLSEKQNRNNSNDDSLFYFNCREIYDNLSDKSQFISFIRDSLNMSCLVMTVVDQMEKQLDKNQLFCYKLLGCSFYLQ